MQTQFYNLEPMPLTCEPVETIIYKDGQTKRRERRKAERKR